MIKVTLREKKLKNGNISLYLDFYPAVQFSNGQTTRREFLKLYLNPKPKLESERQLNKETKAIAESIKSKRQLEIIRGEYGLDIKNRNEDKDFLAYFKEVSKNHHTTESTKNTWQSAYIQLAKFTNDNLTFGMVNADFVKSYKNYLLQESKLSPNTTHNYFSKFKSVLSQAFKEKLIKENLKDSEKGIKQTETRREFLTFEEVQLLAKTDCQPDYLKRAFLFSCLTGLRYSDVEALRWADLQGNKDDKYFIRFAQKKTKGEETLHISEQAVELMGEPKEPESKIFKGLDKSTWLNQKLKLWVSNAGIQKNISFHCSRHTYATLQLTYGTDLYTVSKLLGHKDIKTTQIYAKIIDSKKKEAVDRIPKFDLKKKNE